MMLIIIAIIGSLLDAAHAQSVQQPPPSPQQQALVQKLMEEINTGIQLRAELLKMQQQVKELQETKEKQCDAK